VVRYPAVTAGAVDVIYGKASMEDPLGGPMLYVDYAATAGNPAAIGAQIDVNDTINSSEGIADATPHRGTLGLQVDATLQ
jgi:hypothetical protein